MKNRCGVLIFKWLMRIGFIIRKNRQKFQKISNLHCKPTRRIMSKRVSSSVAHHVGNICSNPKETSQRLRAVGDAVLYLTGLGPMHR